jgi:hypothetical protein
MENNSIITNRVLNDEECRHYRDLLRSARYAALANSEDFDKICFALESLGLHLLGSRGNLGKYKDYINRYAISPHYLHNQSKLKSTKRFDDLYTIVREARNDNMHTGVYARHATAAAIELCIIIEEGLMKNVKKTIGSIMINSPITVENWQPLARARILMLMHSFSYLPVWYNNDWWLLSELSLARFLIKAGNREKLLGMTISEATNHQPKLELVKQSILHSPDTTIDELLFKCESTEAPYLWLVTDSQRRECLIGILTPFDLI